MNLDELNFDLPPELIAQRPLAQRDDSRMLLLDRGTGQWQDRQFREFPELLRGDELVVFNNAKVIPARLFGKRIGIHAADPGAHSPAKAEHLQAEIEVLLVRQLEPHIWETLVRPGRKIPVGERIVFGGGELEGIVQSREDFGLRVIRFTAKSGFQEALANLGHIPLPPYIKREDDPADRERYQTVYAKQGSAVAAPTAGLHFTANQLERLRERKIETVEITLDVGLGTFEPVRAEKLEDHKIHTESYEISEKTAHAIARAKQENRPVLAIGTTTVRALEDAAEKAAHKQQVLQTGALEAAIFLYPGKPLRIVTQLLTNFHLPQSSLLALVATFTGREELLRAYRHAVDQRYRFYSYGDCMLIR
ncbi:MAG TPA: tRNA preQ1(34) S-adenosylmethionine ribosyltransferase-isomerase QueA [Candidatus Acidoferrales bacterium]